ncbi:MAG: LytTR family DNA-binding domain-containing protein [Lachnospiraceae bacterium]|nr:LytTR family DNA-binding domain-containing protein [Lachnospiraceae bacterium]
MAISIAICDDEIEICSQLESILTEQLAKRKIECSIEVFNTGKALCRELKRTKYDLLFLDIELPEMDGIQIGRYIREELNNQILQIAYISSKQEYAMELFDNRPINFLVKPIVADKVKEKVLDKYFRLFSQDNPMFSYKKRSDIFKVPIEEILYFQNNNRKVTVVTLDHRDEFYGSMDGIYSEVKNHKFLYIHKSTIVNYRYITRLSANEVTMTDGEIFSISQSRRKIIRSECLRIRRGEK